MRQDEPRLPALGPEDWDEAAAAVMAPFVEAGNDHNIFRTLAHHPDLMRRWLVFGNHVLAKSTLPARARELVILRVGRLCGCAYEWSQHVVIARDVGITDDEIRRVAVGPGADGWTDADRALLRAADELHAEATVTDDTWAALARELSAQQLLDLVFTVGQYTTVSMALNTLGVELDEGLEVVGWDG